MSFQLKNECIAKSTSKMYLDDVSADIKFTFKYGDQVEIVPAHKAILASASPVFYTMFYGSLKEGESVEIVDASADAFREFIKFFYLAEVTLRMEHIDEVARLVDRYDILKHVNACITSLGYQLTEANLVWGYILSTSFDNTELKQICEQTIKVSPGILKSEAFLHCDQRILKHILQMDDFACQEIDVFNACLKWAQLSCQENEFDEKDPKNLRKQLGDCFHLIRFGAMDRKDIGVLMNDELNAGLFTPDELIDLLRITTTANFKSNKFSQTPRTEAQLYYSRLHNLNFYDRLN